MNAHPENAETGRPIDRWFASYAHDHQHPANRLIHWIAVPLILWSVIAILWTIPVLATWFRPGLWSALAMFFAWMFYYRASRRIGLGMLAVFVAMAWLTRWLYYALGREQLLYVAIGVFVVAWVAQFIGHSKLFEGKRPSFLTDLRYLLVGPAWLLSKVYRRLGWRW
jgi:uncharacterized membrane protein YGL010W